MLLLLVLLAVAIIIVVVVSVSVVSRRSNRALTNLLFLRNINVLGSLLVLFFFGDERGDGLVDVVIIVVGICC